MQENIIDSRRRRLESHYFSMPLNKKKKKPASKELKKKIRKMENMYGDRRQG